MWGRAAISIRRSVPAFLAGALMCLQGCGSEPAGDPPAQPDDPDRQEACADLDSLFGLMDRLEAHLQAEGALDEGLMEKTSRALEKNLHSGAQDCHYLNHHHAPERNRFFFAELLTEKTSADTLPLGIYYLIRFRGLFSEDPEITEFFSEELAHVAHANPHAYTAYIRRYPNQKNMLLHSTRWRKRELPGLIGRFRAMQGGEEIAGFLEELHQESHSEAPG